jgi:hypothetical protein
VMKLLLEEGHRSEETKGECRSDVQRLCSSERRRDEDDGITTNEQQVDVALRRLQKGNQAVTEQGIRNPHSNFRIHTECFQECLFSRLSSVVV